MIKTYAIDDGIMAILREDGRLSNREVARRLDVSEGTVRQRLKKLQDAGAIRIGVVTDANRVGLAVSAWVRVAVSPEHTDSALRFKACVILTFNADGQIISDHTYSPDPTGISTR